ncbi:AAA family ATPase [Nonomuraea sp. NPDC050404]|uniref:AAA family ATPase n=1 Tax=Nonomuraea sp. NPDC050404 TaxID=3155783 RepID=UPI0034058396
MRNPQLLGRDGELAILDDLVGRLPGAGGAIILRGEPGIGRTALLRAAVVRGGAAGAEVLQVTGVHGAPPYAGLRELLEPVLGAGGRLPESQRALLQAALHGAAEGAAGAAEGAGEGAPRPLAVAKAALHLLTACAWERPLLVAVDDAHLLDRPSCEALGFIARRLGHDPILLVATTRTATATDLTATARTATAAATAGSHASAGPAAAAAGSHTSAGDAERAVSPLTLDVRPLDDVTARVLLGRHAPALTVTARERILQVARGNPLALTELPLAWRDGGPSGSWTSPAVTPRLAEAFAGGLRDLPPATRDALLVTAVDYVGDLPEILAAAALLAGHEVTGDLDAARDLVQLIGTTLRFTHPVIRAAVLAAEPQDRRRAAHAALARVLPMEPHRRTWHQAKSAANPAGDLADALADLRPSTPNRRGVAPIVWALELSARLTADRVVRARRFLTAAQYASGLGRPHIVHDLLNAADQAGLTLSDRTRLEWLRDVCDEDTSPDPARVTRLCAIAKRSAAADDLGVALDLLLGAALRIQRTAPGPAAQAVVAATADVLAAGVPASTADPRHIAALALAEPVLRNQAVAERLPASAAVSDLPDAEGLRLLGIAAHAIGDPVKAVALLGRAEPTLRDHGRAGPLAQVLILRMSDLCVLGDWERAIPVAEEAHRVLAGTRQPGWADALMAAEAVAAGLRGDTERALKLAARADGTRRFDLVAGVRLARGLGWLAARRHERAHEELRPLFVKPIAGLGRQAFAAVIPYMAAAVGADRLEEARDVLAKLEDVACIASAALLHVQLPYARAVLAPDAEAEELFRAALGLDLARWPLVRAATELAYADWLRRHGRTPESRTARDAARDTLRLLGAPLWADPERDGTVRCQAEDVLSPRELRIAELAAAGLSNREIGAQVHLSARTVGSYLSGMFRKLGVTARGQLARRLRGPLIT